MNAIGVPYVSLTLDLARAAGVDLRPPWSTEQPCCVPWTTFTRHLTDLETRLGGPDAMDQAVRNHWFDVTSRWGNWRGVFVSPAALLRFVLESLVPAVFPQVNTRVTQAGDEAVRVDVEILPPHQPSGTFLRLLGRSLAQWPLQAGFGAAQVTVQSNGRHATLVFGVDGARHVMIRRAQAQDNDAAFQEQVERASSGWALSRRQTDVLRLLLLGRSNKEIASRLNIVEGTVELHVTQLLRKARVTSRTEMMALFWAG